MLKKWLMQKLYEIKYKINHIRSLDKPSDLYFYNPCEKRYVDKFIKDVKNIDFPKALQNLIRGLDKNSIEIVYRILNRMDMASSNPSRFHDFFTKDELQEYDKHKKYKFTLRWNNQCFFDKYVFPKGSSPDSVALYFKCHLNSLEKSTMDKVGGGGSYN